MEWGQCCFVVFALLLIALSVSVSADKEVEGGQAVAMADQGPAVQKRSLDAELAGYYPRGLLDSDFQDDLEADKRSTLFRFGKRGSLFRFGKRGTLLRFGKRGGTLFRFGKRPSELRLSKKPFDPNLGGRQVRLSKKPFDPNLGGREQDAAALSALLQSADKRQVDSWHWGRETDE